MHLTALPMHILHIRTSSSQLNDSRKLLFERPYISHHYRINEIIWKVRLCACYYKYLKTHARSINSYLIRLSVGVTNAEAKQDKNKKREREREREQRGHCCISPTQYLQALQDRCMFFFWSKPSLTHVYMRMLFLTVYERSTCSMNFFKKKFVVYV